MFFWESKLFMSNKLYELLKDKAPKGWKAPKTCKECLPGRSAMCTSKYAGKSCIYFWKQIFKHF